MINEVIGMKSVVQIQHGTSTTDFIGKYRLIHFSGVDITNSCVILDTNVCTNIYNLYYNGSNSDVLDVIRYIKFQLENMYKNPAIKGLACLYDFGLVERNCSRTLGTRYQTWVDGEDASKAILLMNNEQLDALVGSRHSRGSEVPSSARQQVIDDIADKVLLQILPLYGSALHFLSLITDSRTSNWDPFDLYDCQISWMRTDLNLLLGYEQCLFAIILFGKDSGTARGKSDEARNVRYRTQAKKFFKLDDHKQYNPDDLAEHAWNAAWDLLYVQYLKNYQTGVVGSLLSEDSDKRKPIDCVLISRDFDPHWLQLNTMVAAYPDSNINDAIGFDIEKIINPDQKMSNSNIEVFYKKWKALWSKYTTNQSISAERTKQVFSCIRRLENDLEVTPSLLLRRYYL